ncbi:glycosyltransferase family 2 protein [Bifidobacterium pseudolongum]|uniref:glycosyltransferase family 2 protein n=1 Tax=Bifidobacterium pseudolongum TaxID=1694 RepID=UPI0010220F8C
MSEEPTTVATPAEMRMPPRTMLVIPCYNEEPGLRTTAGELRRILRQLIDVHQIDARSCVLFVDDGSKDGTWGVIRALHNEDPELFHGLKLAHNKGHQNALFAGLMHALHSPADVAVSMDADLQDDPGAVGAMVEAWREGAEIVYGVRDSRETDTAFKRGTAHMFYALMKGLGTETVPDHADYRLMSHTALEALAQYHESNLFLRGIVPSLGFPTAKVYYKRGERVAGESKYPLRKMVAFAVQGITSFSTKPLSLITGTGIVSVIVGIAMLIYTLISVCSGNAVAGWGSMMCSLWILGGLILVALGIVGEYIAKIYIEVKARPRYIIEETI